MKKYLITATIMTFVPIAAFAGTGNLPEGDACSAEYIYNGAFQDPCAPGITCIPFVLHDSSKTAGVCCSYVSQDNYGTWTAASTGYQKRSVMESFCGYSRTSYQYRCADGYYGKSDDGKSGCTTCPANAEPCAAGSETFTCKSGYMQTSIGCYCPPNATCTSTSFTCNEGYYKDGSTCAKCPTNATCPAGSTTFTCKKGYYKYGTTCSRCPKSGTTYGTTASTGATSATQCYIPKATILTDSTGEYTYTQHCYYK